MTNRLADETSPYLLQHAENPVDWYPWGPEALERAQQTETPILLSIGYSACHWCHVMERESFEDPAIAAVMNRNFINIKVDREERPDLDEIYMAAVQAFNQGRGGWPMTVFLTPRGVPYFGGTYFPPKPRHGLPGFGDLVERMGALYRGNRGEVDRITAQVQDYLDGNARLPEPEGALRGNWFEVIEQVAERDFDPTDGGFGSAPKFPPHATLQALLASHALTGSAKALRLATATLDAMAKGGMHDLLRGGFCRYSVDREWRIPHFEKMLFDNGQLALVYLRAYQLTGEDRYQSVCRSTLDWVLAEMSLEDGGFASSLDADSEGEEGLYYSFTLAEVLAAAGPELGPAVAKRLQITAEGTFEHGRSVLRLEQPLEQQEPELRAELEQVLGVLRGLQAQRVRPGRDDKCIVAWNALVIEALAAAGGVLGDSRYVDAAVAAADFLWSNCRVEGRLHRTFKDRRVGPLGLSDDYALFGNALIALYEATFDLAHLDRAIELAEALVELFWDPAGGVFSTGSDAPALITRTQPLVGNQEPSGNGATALLFTRLAALCGRGDLAEKADALLLRVQPGLMQAPRSMGPEPIAAWWRSNGGRELGIVGDPALETTQALLATARRYDPCGVLALVSPGAPLPPALRKGELTERLATVDHMEAQGFIDSEQARRYRAALERPARIAHRLPWMAGREVDAPTAFLCEGFQCRLPVNDPESLHGQLDEAFAGSKPSKLPRSRVRAPALPSEPARWLGDPVALGGKVVVLDFWTFCCINCLHVLPELEAIEAHFEGRPVQVVGVHCAKFDHEKDPSAVEQAVAQLGVHHPVLLDGDHQVWSEYAVRSWPTLAVIDPTGRVVYQQGGEARRETLIELIEATLEEAEAAGTLKQSGGQRLAMPSPSSTLRFPGKLCVDAAGERLFVSDTGHHQVREYRLSGLEAERVRVWGTGLPGRVDGPAERVQFRAPQGLAVHEDTLFVADTGNHSLRQLDLKTGTVTTVAGTGGLGRGGQVDPVNPTHQPLRSPWAVEVIPSADGPVVMVAMAGTHQLWLYLPEQGRFGPFAGTGREAHTDGPLTESAFAQPSGLTRMGSYLVVADSEISSIRFVDLVERQVGTLVGAGLFDFGDVDGVGQEVRLQHPLGVHAHQGQLYVADTYNHKLKHIDPQTTATRTLDVDGLNSPEGLTGVEVDGVFWLLVADTGNHRVVAVRPDTGEQVELAL